ncbi:MAG: two-component system, OmpR family, operon response regulator KdpE [Pyrinomonadaceae bacterium]|jgi:two-component system KDP operon response regulator KdpE|nr:two-component system, OmpR family, operon response regulator KdpE [Pyrinomonadaceae bacterium]
MADKQRILIVDDEPQIGRVMRTSLATHGFEVRVAADGEAGLELFNDWRPALVITDLSMPNVGGLEFCRRVRLVSEVPIIVLSVKSEESLKVQALDAGADDYVTKPFGMKELLARIRAALRRMPPRVANELSLLEAGDFKVDPERRKTTVKDREVHLTPKEFELLLFMVHHPGAVLTHHKLLAAVWGSNYTEQTEYLRVFIRQLRKKLETDPANPKYILTEPWIGYRFNPGGSEE